MRPQNDLERVERHVEQADKRIHKEVETQRDTERE